MVKITTRQQFEILVQQMEQNPSIARGVRAFGETKANTEHVWKEISSKLNSYGPPTRTSEKCQRVWIHFKAKLRKKMAHNRRNITGGGPSAEISLSALEQAAADFLQMGTSVDPPGRTF
ncbi:PREDICTED: uncharacterized protein LOC108364943 [Rhagoletis zephyria]|nr:PREDICTED: uncharacterized protein LOC108364943 [Rhagoletis zephyria]XP_036341358.1 uncharacterized protein LOC118750732 [Rhagoletis pomonella]